MGGTLILLVCVAKLLPPNMHDRLYEAQKAEQQLLSLKAKAVSEEFGIPYGAQVSAPKTADQQRHEGLPIALAPTGSGPGTPHHHADAPLIAGQ